MIKKLVKCVIGIVLALVILVVGYFVFMMITDYKPSEALTLKVESINTIAKETLKKNQPLSVMTFNIGYCGLDMGQDFFLDGGTMSRSRSKEQTEKNLTSITEFIKNQNPTFILLQEVDIKSSRSSNINQLKYMKEQLVDFESSFAINYKVPWVPVPLTHPMGTVYGGLLNFFKYESTSVTRYSLPGQEPWPRQLAELDRCFVENRMPVEGGKELVLINLHLSAYDKGGNIRKQQLDFLSKHLVQEYAEGNYVIVGGDWNHVIPGTDPKQFKWTEQWPDWCVEMPQELIPQDFKWAVDKNIPTVRQNSTAYQEGENFVAIIDGLLVSPNVDIVKVEGHNLGFENSDHNPVTGTFILK